RALHRAPAGTHLLPRGGSRRVRTPAVRRLWGKEDGMRGVPSQQQLDAAVAYDTLFVPALFGPWAPRVADAAHAGPGDRALDVACGTGVLARSLFTRAGTSGVVDGLDPDPGMLAVAAL